MKGTFRILTFAKIPVYVHWSFSLVLFYLWYEQTRSSLSLLEVGWLGLFILSVFVCVVLHEFGHALTARHYGVETKDIILSPIGGIARLTRLPDQPLQEFFVALAGPMVNLVIAILLSAYFLFIPFEDLYTLMSHRSPRAFVPLLVALNLLLAVFNLLPAFPLDGGRIFRALLSIRLGRTKATKVAALLGQGLAIICFYIAFLKSDFVLAFFGAFVFVMAAHEYRNVKMTALLDEGKIAEIMHEPLWDIRRSSPIQQAIDLFKKGMGKNFLVFDETGELVLGVLKESALLEAMKTSPNEALIDNYLESEFAQAQIHDSLRDVFLKMFEKDSNRIVAIYDGPQLKGILDIDMIYHYLEIRRKLGRQKEG